MDPMDPLNDPARCRVSMRLHAKMIEKNPLWEDCPYCDFDLETLKPKKKEPAPVKRQKRPPVLPTENDEVIDISTPEQDRAKTVTPALIAPAANQRYINGNELNQWKQSSKATDEARQKSLQQDATDADKKRSKKKITASVGLRMYGCEWEESKVGGILVRAYTKIQPCKRTTPVDIILDQMFPDHDALIRYIFEKANVQQEYRIKRWTFTGLIITGNGKDVQDLAMYREKPVSIAMLKDQYHIPHKGDSGVYLNLMTGQGQHVSEFTQQKRKTTKKSNIQSDNENVSESEKDKLTDDQEEFLTPEEMNERIHKPKVARKKPAPTTNIKVEAEAKGIKREESTSSQNDARSIKTESNQTGSSKALPIIKRETRNTSLPPPLQTRAASARKRTHSVLSDENN